MNIKGVLVGHAEDREALTGVSVILFPKGAVASCDVRGSAPGTREVALLEPTKMIRKIHGIALCGGSAFGLRAAEGVVRYLKEKNIGFDTGVVKVPIVPSGVIFDLGIGRKDVYPDEEMGYKACLNAKEGIPQTGSVGVGTGATVGKVLGMKFASKSGIGFHEENLPHGIKVSALTVVNAFGDVYEDGKIIAGARKPVGSGFLNTEKYIRTLIGTITSKFMENTTLSVVATNAEITKEEAKKISEMAHDGMARAIRPVHTMFDGDIVFTAGTGEKGRISVSILGTVAAICVEKSIINAVKSVTNPEDSQESS